MKQNRYRAFDSFQNKYVFVGFHIVGEVTCFDGIEHIISETAKERNTAKGYTCSIEAWNDFSFEQWLERTDTNGVDVYEGDRVRA